MLSVKSTDASFSYKVDFSLQPSPLKIAKFRVEFQDGQMGFALTSAEGIGVIVSKIGSFSLFFFLSFINFYP